MLHQVLDGFVDEVSSLVTDQSQRTAIAGQDVLIQKFGGHSRCICAQSLSLYPLRCIVCCD